MVEDKKSIGIRVFPFKQKNLCVINVFTPTCHSLEEEVERLVAIGEAVKEETGVIDEIISATVFCLYSPFTYPSKYEGKYSFLHRISRGEKLVESWEKLANDIFIYGIEMPTGRKGRRGKRVTLLHGLLVCEDPFLPPFLPTQSGLSQKDAEEYFRGIWEGREPSTGESYTYGERFVEGKEELIEVERGPVSILIRKERDVELDEPPCLTSITAIFSEDASIYYSYFRDWNVLWAAPLNLYALMRIMLATYEKRHERKKPNPLKAKLIVAYKCAGNPPPSTLASLQRRVSK